VGLSLSSVIHLHGSALEGGVVPGRQQSSDSREKGAPRSGVCEREAEKLVGQKAVRIGRSMRAPKKLRDVPPKYPELPPGTQASGVWLGEILINDSGNIARVRPLREIRFVPPFPAFNNAITDAIRQWEFEPLHVQGKAMPVCMTVTVNINWK
jgi:outer membrane biosynthesis protein TonB